MRSSVHRPPKYKLIASVPPQQAAVFAFVGAVFLYALSLARWRLRSHGLPLPPGPKSPPFFGNIMHMQKPELWRANRELLKIYGEIVNLPVLGQSIMLLGSQEAVKELLEKRALVTSERVPNVLVGMSGQDVNFAWMTYDAKWRHHRRAFAQHFPTKVIPNQLTWMWDSALSFVRKLRVNPDDIEQHIRYTFASAIVTGLYGLDVAESKDENIALMEKVIEGVQSFVPGRFLVQYMPFAQYWPDWTPGPFGEQLRELTRFRESAKTVKKTMYAKVRSAMERGESRDAILAGLLQQIDEKGDKADPEELDFAQNVVITAFEGAIDTTYATLSYFFVAMALYPEAQKKAQAELDAVIGSDRLPTHADKDSLPYLNAVYQEVLRWQNVAPFGLPHMTAEDMEYKGYFIPKGTLLYPQTWALMHDPDVYADPDRFFPDRFFRDGQVVTDVPDPREFVFGFGRRICPGVDYAEQAVFINMAMALHVFDITPARDANGKSCIREPLKLEGTFLTYPEDLRFVIKPRSPQAEALILGATMKA